MGQAVHQAALAWPSPPQAHSSLPQAPSRTCSPPQQPDTGPDRLPDPHRSRSHLPPAMAPERTAAAAAVGLASTQPSSTPREGPVGIVRRLVQGLHTDNAEQAAGVVASLDLALPTAADGVAAEVGGLGEIAGAGGKAWERAAGDCKQQERWSVAGLG